MSSGSTSEPNQIFSILLYKYQFKNSKEIMKEEECTHNILEILLTSSSPQYKLLLRNTKVCFSASETKQT